ncbi:hypothetical protein [Bacillus siamensis]|uniref:hypothetical protein n=1 Tax=Bacillus siamensis TaxID=659243 RepID=UPI0005F8BAEB|nr:hypothetical protein [Bacillus siamensis]
MIYAGRIQNQQYTQYANRISGYRPDYAGITKAAALANDRRYREVERRQEITAAAEKNVHEEKRKRSLSCLPQIMGKGRLINQYV